MSDLPFLPEAEIEFLEAIDYYEAASIGLGEEFVIDVENAVARITSFPKHGSPSPAGTRRIVLRRFPFDIVYLEENDEILIVAVAHQHRSPYYWRSRI